jgi:Alginate lyase/Secreted repeat of unknown function
MRLRAALVTAAAAATALAAVTTGADSPPTNTAPPSPGFAVASYSPGAAGSTATADPDPAAVTLAAHDTSQVGPTVLDEGQRTLYRFDRDTANPSASSCVDACAVTWPPVLVAQGGSVRLEGVAPTGLGTVARGVTPTGDKAAETAESRAAAAAAGESARKVSNDSTGDGAKACPATDSTRAAAGLAETAGATGGGVMRALVGADRSDSDSSSGEGSDGNDSSRSASAPSGSTSTTAKLPGEVLDLADWYLTLPTGKAGDPDTVEQPALGKLTNEFFKVDDSGGVVFSARGDGVTTKNSHFPRSELREMNGSEKAAWSNINGRHTLDVCEAITQVPSAKPEVVGAQIHDDKDDVLQIRLEGQKLMVQYDDGKSEQLLDANYKLGTPYDVRIIAADSKVEVLYNGQRKAELPLSGSGWYWKVGAYVQSNTSKGDGADASGAVTVYALNVDHNNDAATSAGDGAPTSAAPAEKGSEDQADDKADDKDRDKVGEKDQSAAGAAADTGY